MKGSEAGCAAVAMIVGLNPDTVSTKLVLLAPRSRAGHRTSPMGRGRPEPSG